MRTLLIAAVACLAASPALAYCPTYRSSNPADDMSFQTELTLCRQAELADRQQRLQDKLDIDAAIQAQQKTFELELRMHDMFNQTQFTQFQHF